MAKPAPTVEIVNEHREALALACYERNASLNVTTHTLEDFRIECNSIRFREQALLNPNIMLRYVAIRGFDPREVQSAPKLRWLS